MAVEEAIYLRSGWVKEPDRRDACTVGQIYVLRLGHLGHIEKHGSDDARGPLARVGQLFLRRGWHRTQRPPATPEKLSGQENEPHVFAADSSRACGRRAWRAKVRPTFSQTGGIEGQNQPGDRGRDVTRTT